MKKPMASQGLGGERYRPTKASAAVCAGARSPGLPWKSAAKTWRAAVLDIKAWLHNEAVKTKGGAICSFCQHLSVTPEDMAEHMLACERHPISRLRRDVEAAIEALFAEAHRRAHEDGPDEYNLGVAFGHKLAATHLRALLEAWNPRK